ncbi:MAG: hypothetical protein ACRDGM_16370 [bacterium]
MSFVARFVNPLVVLASAIETLAIASLSFFAGALALPVAIGARLVLFVLEHIVTFIRANAHFPNGRDLGRLAAVSAVETATWDVWFLLAGASAVGSQVGAIVVLAGGLYVGHALEQNATRQCRGFLTRIVRGETVVITVIETVTGVVWRILALASTAFLPIFDLRLTGIIAPAILFIGLNAEHAESAGQARTCYE